MSASASESVHLNAPYGAYVDSLYGEPDNDIIVDVPRGYRLRSGEVLTDARLQLKLCGNSNGPHIVALGGISAGRCVGGDKGWWRGTVGAGDAIDLDRFAVIGVDFSPLEDARLTITAHDQADLLCLALDALKIRRVYAIVGASYGGMVALAFAALTPERVERLCVIAAAHRPSMQGRAWRGVQRRIIEFGLRQGEPAQGLALARQLAMITYRTPQEFAQRFAPETAPDGSSEIDRYLSSRGDAYTRVMAPQRWLSLSQAIDLFAVDPAQVRVPTTVLAFTTDCLVPLEDMRELAARLPSLAAFHEVDSLYGHDAFLKETAALRPILSAFLKD